MAQLNRKSLCTVVTGSFTLLRLDMLEFEIDFLPLKLWLIGSFNEQLSEKLFVCSVNWITNTELQFVLPSGESASAEPKFNAQTTAEKREERTQLPLFLYLTACCLWIIITTRRKKMNFAKQISELPQAKRRVTNRATEIDLRLTTFLPPPTFWMFFFILRQQRLMTPRNGKFWV